MEGIKQMSRQEFYGDNSSKKAIQKSDRKINAGKIQTERIRFQTSTTSDNTTVGWANRSCIVGIDYFELTEAKPICFGAYYNYWTGEYESDRLFVIQKANVRLLGPHCPSVPCPYDPTACLGTNNPSCSGMWLFGSVYRRNIDNPLSQWEWLGNAQAFVLDGNDNIIDGELPVGEDIKIGFGPYFPASILAPKIYKGIPSRRPYEEILIELCLSDGSFFGWSLDADGLPITLGAVPCIEEKISISTPLDWDEPNQYNIREDYSSRGIINVEYGEPHTWTNLHGQLRALKPSYHAHSMQEYPQDMNPPPPYWGCGSILDDHPHDPCAGSCRGLSAWYYGMYRFGPYPTRKDYSTAYGLNCPGSKDFRGHGPDCCEQPLLGIPYDIRTISRNNDLDIIFVQPSGDSNIPKHGACCFESIKNKCMNATEEECNYENGVFSPDKFCSDSPCTFPKSSYTPN